MERQISVDILAPLKEFMPSWTNEQSLFLMKGQWLGFAALIFIALILERLARFYSAKFIAHLLKQQDVELSIEQKKKIVFPIGFVAFSTIWLTAIPLLELPLNIENFLNKAWDIALTIALVWSSYNLVDGLALYFEKVAAKTDNKFDDVLVPMARKTLKVLVVLIGLIFIGNSFSVNMKSIIAGLGIGGLAFALAAKDTISNLFGSFTVLMDQPFQIGDYVKIDGKVEGTVEEVGLRSTKIRTASDSLVSLPNGNLINANIDNLGKRKFRRFDTKLQIEYGTPIEKIEGLCEEIRYLIQMNPRTNKDNHHVYLNNFGSSALEVLIIVFWDVSDYQTELSERHNFHLDIIRIVEKMRIKMAFPTQTLHMRKENVD